MDKKHHIAIYTTASIPWLTGTSINPLFRAAYLAKDGEQKVTLVIPWLPLKDQEHVFPSGVKFNSHLEQEKCVRQWLEERTGFASNFSIRFYPGKFSLDKRSILALGDITVIIPDDEADVAVLEEPEHLTWFHHGKRWKKKFRLVVGIVHTNYLEYVKRERNAVEAFFLKQINSWVVDLYCHKVIRLSAATQDLPRSLVCNVHGVNPKLLQIGMKTIEKQQNDNQAFSKGVYYIGKMLWSKGYKELLRLLRDHQKELTGLEIDLYGSGEDSAQIEVAFKKLELTVRVHPARDHADPLFHKVAPIFVLVGGSRFPLQNSGKKTKQRTQLVGFRVPSVNYKEHILDSHLNNGVNSRLRWTFNYGMKAVYDWKNAAAGCTFCEKHDLTGIINFSYKVLLNPSTTDVVCTTTAEALAMGKIVVCANHPSNEFFMQFQNCRTYDDGKGFVKATLEALADEPAPLADKQRHELSWEAATERFLKSAQLDVVPVKKTSKTSSKSFLSTSFSLNRKLEDASASVHFMGTGFLSSQPDEEQCKELGLAIPSKKNGFSSGRWI